MPVIKLQHVVSFSTEDKNSMADNLLKPEGHGKWTCGQAGEKQATVVIQFEKSSKIHQVDIGNAHSAFVEVLVGRSTRGSEQDYQVLLVASSFMSPMEGRNGSNPNRVRMFEADKLSKAAIDQKWDRVKVVCTQPFNKTTTYGISFIKFHSPPEEGSTAGSGEGQLIKLGSFKLKSPEEMADRITAGSLFVNRGKEKTATASLTGAAAARAASRLADEAQAGKKEQKNQDPKAATPVKRKYEETKTVRSSEDFKTPTSTKKEKIVIKPPNRTSIEKPSMNTKSKEKDVIPPPAKKKKSDSDVSREFSKLMKGVVFVLSGFQNPLRSELRDKAVEMGAQYRPDWAKGCTHLICAFSNTPKFNQVNGKGKIVSHNWIIDCHKQKKIVPWRRYKLNGSGSPSDSSTEEEEDVAKKPSPRKQSSQSEHSDKKASPQKTAAEKKTTQKQDEEDMYAGSTDAEDTDDDTEDEIQRVRDQNRTKDKPVDPYAGSTDEDEGPGNEDNTNQELPELPDVFTGKHFFLYGDFTPSERRQLKRIIITFNGVLEEYMGDDVNFVITAVDWDEKFDEALSDNGNLVFVRPTWIYECSNKNKLLPHQRYMVVPS